jgi:hypothetical protein
MCSKRKCGELPVYTHIHTSQASARMQQAKRAQLPT